MALTQKQIDEIKEELDTCKRPIFFFHDDPDGLCSFLLLYRYIQEGKGVVIKTNPKLDLKFALKVSEYGADKVFVLDIANIAEDFVENVNVPIIWVDHHPLPDYKYEKVKYYNCRETDPKDSRPVTYWCYQVVKQDILIGFIGCVGDAYFPDFADQLSNEQPHMLDASIKSLTPAFYDSQAAKLLRIFAFSLKGKTSDVMKSVKVLTRIKDPNEILNQTTSQGKFIYKRFEKVDEYYKQLIIECTQKVTPDKVFVFIYPTDRMALTKDLANEVFFRYPDKFIIIGREKGEDVNVSLRYKENIIPIFEKALQGVEGYGGGHEYACGASIKQKDFKKFVEQIRVQLK